MAGFPKQLLSARTKSGLTQEQLALELGVAKSAVSAWERNKENPNFKILPKLSEVLEISLDTLICGIGDDEEKPVGKHVIQTRNEDEEKLLKAYRKLPVKSRKGLLDLLSA